MMPFADLLSVSSPHSREADWDAISFHYFWELAKNVPEAGVHVESKLFSRRVEMLERQTLSI